MIIFNLPQDLESHLNNSIDKARVSKINQSSALWSYKHESRVRHECTDRHVSWYVIVSNEFHRLRTSSPPSLWSE